MAVGDAFVACTFLTIEKDNLMRTHEVRDFSKRGELKLDRSDEIIAGTLVCVDGAAVRS